MPSSGGVDRSRFRGGGMRLSRFGISDFQDWKKMFRAKFVDPPRQPDIGQMFFLRAKRRRQGCSGARFALIVGDSELKAGKIALKPLRDGTPQRLVTVEECIDLLRQTAASA